MKFSNYSFHNRENKNELVLTVEVPLDKDYGEERTIVFPFKSGKVLLEDEILELISNLKPGGVNIEELEKILNKLLGDYVSRVDDTVVEGNLIFNILPSSNPESELIATDDNQLVNLRTVKKLIEELMGDLPSGPSGDIRYSNSKPTPISLGGIHKGETFNNLTMKQMWDKLLYPYVKPEITRLDTPKKVFLLGESTGESINISWSTTEHNSINAETMKLTLDNQVLGEGNLTKNGNKTFPIEPIKLDIEGTRSIVLSFKDVNENTISRRLDLTWVNTLFYGCSPNKEIEVSELESFKTKNSNNFSGDYSYPPGGYKYLVYPSTWPDIKKAINPESNFDVPMEKVKNISITSNTGIVQTYKVYRTYNVLNGDYKIRFS